jgi:hypothetical protein
VTHYCPKHVAPLFSEQRPVSFYDFNGHLYTSGHYRELAPLEQGDAQQ